MPRKYLAIATCRVSSLEQIESNSLNRQLGSVKKAADYLGVDFAENGIWSGSVSSKSGSNYSRKDLKEMLARCRKDPRIKYLIVDEVDRFMRSMDEMFYFEVLFREEVGVKVWYAEDPDLNSDDPFTKLRRAMEAFKAEGSNLERQIKSIKGQAAALKEGKYPFSPKPGYKRGYERGVQEKRDPHAKILQQTLLNILSRNMTPTQALVEFNKSDFFIDGKAKYKMDKFRKIVTDPFYAGIVEIDKQVKVRNENGLHDPLISKAQHIELVKIMNDKHKNQKGPRKNGNPKYPASNLVTHEPWKEHHIGRLVGFDHTNGKNTTVIYEKYRCRACGAYIKRQDLHDDIQSLFTSTPITQAGLRHLMVALNKVWDIKEGQAEQEANRVGHKIQQLSESVANQVEAATDPSNAAIRDDILASIASKKQAISELENELSRLSEKAEADKDRFLRFAFGFVKNMGSEFFNVSRENRLRCKQLVFPGGFYLNADNKVYTPEVSVLYRLVANKKDLSEPEKSLLVRLMDYRWNHLLPELYLLYSKLDKFGIVFMNGEVTYLGDKELDNV